MPKASDDTFLNKLVQNFSRHPSFSIPSGKGRERQFCVKHYAGPVNYSVPGFLAKNQDTLHPHLTTLLQKSSNEWIRDLFPEIPTKGRKRTLGGHFKMQLLELIRVLQQTECHFVRCMKPNQNKDNVLDEEYLSLQVRNAGLLQVAQIRQQGFPSRMAFDQFYSRYK